MVADPDWLLSAVLVAGPANGVLVLNGNGSFTYTPDLNFFGADSFTYRASDGALTSNVATVTVTVNQNNAAPVAVAESYTTAEDTVLTVAAPGVLANDTDADGDVLTVVVVAAPVNGVLACNASGSFTYVPGLN